MTRHRTLEVMTALEKQMHSRRPKRGALRSIVAAEARVPLERRWPTYRATGNGRGR